MVGTAVDVTTETPPYITKHTGVEGTLLSIADAENYVCCKRSVQNIRNTIGVDEGEETG